MTRSLTWPGTVGALGIGVLACCAAWFMDCGRSLAQENQEQEDKTVVEDPNKLFEPREFVGTSGQTLKYRLLKPSPYNADREYPLVIFLHGAGERGSDNKAQLKHGMADFCKAKWREKYPCYVLAPQCPEGEKWVDVDWSAPTSEMPAKASASMELLFELADAMVKDSAVNDNRIYITGLSMGGYGTWDALARRPSFFAAAIPICGGGDPKTAERFSKVPLWCFHGDQDQAVAVERSREMIEALKAAGGTPKYTEYPGVGHDSWTATYANPEVFEWLFKQIRKESADTQSGAEPPSTKDADSSQEPGSEAPRSTNGAGSTEQPQSAGRDK